MGEGGIVRLRSLSAIGTEGGRLPEARRGAAAGKGRTGTFFWTTTTAVSLPRIATAVIPEPVMALKAYSEAREQQLSISQVVPAERGEVMALSADARKRLQLLTDLVESTCFRIMDKQRPSSVSSTCSGEQVRARRPAGGGVMAACGGGGDAPSGEKTVRYLAAARARSANQLLDRPRELPETYRS
jgi:hypothetical protein